MNDLSKVISVVNRLGLSAEDIENMSYFEKCYLFNKNPVIAACHFQYRVEVFFREIILEREKYYAIRVGFLLRGSPHILRFLWVLNPVQLNKDTVEDCIEFIDSILSTNLPSEKENLLLHKLIKAFQVYSHSKTCRKYENKPCRFHYGSCFTELLSLNLYAMLEN